MPPRIRITKEDIVKTSLEIVRKEGEEGLNARNVGKALDCSTQPIFFNFSTMEELKEAVRLFAYDLYLDFLKRETQSGKYPEYKAFGMGYIRFAKEEKELFKLLFMFDRSGQEFISTSDRETSIDLIMKANEVSREKAELIQLEMWVFVHGIATMLATSYLDLEWDLISQMLTDVYKGVCTRLMEEEK